MTAETVKGRLLVIFSFAINRNVSPFPPIKRDITESSQVHKLKAKINNTFDAQLCFNENEKKFFELPDLLNLAPSILPLFCFLNVVTGLLSLDTLKVCVSYNE